MTERDENLASLERFFKSAFPGRLVRRLREFDEPLMQPHVELDTVTFAIDDHLAQWLVTVQSNFVREFRRIPRTPRLEAVVALIRKYPRGCHISLGLDEAIIFSGRVPARLRPQTRRP